MILYLTCFSSVSFPYSLMNYCCVSFKLPRVEVLEIGGGRNDGTMSRDEFEKSSRMRRFNFYRESFKKHLGLTQASDYGNNILGEGSGCGVMLAHHLGDVEENVLSNVLHGCMPDKLSGMKEVGSVEGCQVWRPLLPWRKDEILRFAHKYGVRKCVVYNIHV